MFIYKQGATDGGSNASYPLRLPAAGRGFTSQDMWEGTATGCNVPWGASQ